MTTPVFPTEAPFGTWASPITAERRAAAAIPLSDLQMNGGQPFWLEGRPAEQGRYVVMTLGDDGVPVDITGPDLNVRTRVHEYGGGPFIVAGATLIASNFKDQRLYGADLGGASALRGPLTPADYRYADFAADPRAAGALFAVREDHSGDAVRNTIVHLDTTAKGPQAGAVLFERSDFVSSPRPSPDGCHLAFVAWDHPNMPWDTTTLYVAALEGDTITNLVAVAGGRDESVMEPSWDKDGTLYFLSDRCGWWNLYAWRSGDKDVHAILPMAAEFGSPQWILGQSSFALIGDGRAVARYSERGFESLAVIDLTTGSHRNLPLPFVTIPCVTVAGTGTDAAAIVIAHFADQAPAVVRVRLADAAVTILRRPAPLDLPPTLISRAQPIEFPTAGGLTAHAFYYPPSNPGFQPPAGERPPLLVKVHGGPTGACSPALDLSIQYWTSRGFAVADVNYGGSTGFGRAYRQRLRGNWGVVDVEDVTAVVAHLVATGMVDPTRVAIRGGSAGGYTTLAALAFTTTFRAGANYFGVCDLLALARETHKFESRYMDSLVAPLPEGLAIYRARSPIDHLEGFTAPLITLQGAEDKVVLPDQSRRIVAALEGRGVPVAYLEFAGEQHGFRQAENIIRAQEAELTFYGRIFGFRPADLLPPLAIANLD
jgi:dipeptidyl aminopeptidase/acylaminoacyl peptidase